MKKHNIWPGRLLALAFVCFAIGLFLGRNLPQSQAPQRTPTASASVTGPVIDLNQADEAELITLPGIGPTLARRILDYRSNHGGFQSVLELLNVAGIGQSRVETLLPYLTTGG